ncbi:MAG: hypothetical protein OXN25_11870 [Candidatus Poribacteria bacterium]|nr:hypothetical protein [Candidatus Poribacteria bacterium]
MKHLERIGPALLVCFSLGISVILAYTATQRTLSGLESILWQIFVFAGGLAGSFIFGRQSAREAARELVKPHARSAFRRLIFLYLTLRRAASAIESAQDSESQENYQVMLARLEEIVAAQLITADDALEDWNDIVPEEVEELKHKLLSNGIKEDEK